VLDVATGTGLVAEELVRSHGCSVVGLDQSENMLAAARSKLAAHGVYWKPVWAILEDRFGCMLVNARHVKQVPGRKTDVLDAQWLCRLLEAGLLKPSLVPPKPIRTLRNLTRYRKSNIRDRQREANRLHKLLEDTGIKLDCVATDLLGRSGRAMLDALVAGTTDPRVLADLARGRLRKKLPALREALEGRFDSEHALVVGQILAHIDFLDESIERLSAAIEEQIAPFAAAVELLCTIPGVQRRAAEVIIAETGGDMTRLRDRRASGLLGGRVPRQRRIGRQAPLRAHAQGLQVAARDPHRSRARRRPHPRHLPGRPIPPSPRPPRRQQGLTGDRPLTARRRLAHAANRRDLPRPRRRLLHPPRPRPHHPTPRHPAPTPCLLRHPPATAGGDLSGIFS
jgi:transposase